MDARTTTYAEPAALSAPVLTPASLLIARRFSFGLTPDLAREIAGAGTGRNWFVRQLRPDSIADPAGSEVDSWFPYLGRSTSEIHQRSLDGTEKGWRVMRDLSRRTVARRLFSTRQLHEVMVDFWSNLLHVPLGNDESAPARADYDRVIRTYALDSFEHLLQNAITHPAMGINLNNNVSTKDAPNENLGRELLELHTVGFGSGYTEDDVKASARILTGYRVDLRPVYSAVYDPGAHWTGAVKVMGFRADNAKPDGRQVTMAYLSYLANHPRTAERIARRLCVKFVGDDPSPGIVRDVASAYQAHRSAIRPVLTALVSHRDFAQSARRKLRTPQEDWQAMVRALGITVTRPTTVKSFVNVMYDQYAGLGAAPYEWPAPNGYPEVDAAWSGSGRLLQGFAAHQKMAVQSLPWRDATFPDLAAMTPAPPVSLQTMIDAYAQRLLGEPADPALARAVCALLGWAPDHVVTPSEADRPWTRAAIVATVLDSPQHLFR